MKLRYTGATTQQVRWANHDDPRGLLVKGEVYEVIRREVHSWHTKVYLVDFPKLGFNSVMFEEVE